MGKTEGEMLHGSEGVPEERFPEGREVSGARRALSRREFGMRKRVLSLLKEGPMTVPELADALGVPAHEAMWWMMGYVRYGDIVPTGETTDEGYFRYEIAGKDA